MAQGRIRRLVTLLLRWVWVPVVSFVLVVAVAWGGAMWLPRDGQRTNFGTLTSNKVPDAMSQYAQEYTIGISNIGIGIGYYWISDEELASTPENYRLHEFNIIVCRAGLPFRCSRWTWDLRHVWPEESSMWISGIKFGQENIRRIPLMPEPVGMVLNVLIYSAAIVLPRFAWRRVVVIRRRRNSLCVHCKYPLGDFTICPECGNQTGGEA